MFEKTKINEKEAGKGPFKKKIQTQLKSDTTTLKNYLLSLFKGF